MPFVASCFSSSLLFSLLFRRMTGFLQTMFYFGYTAVACTALAIMTGTISVTASSLFVRAIYSSIKMD
jgi:transmembrane 9 superfamily protein 3